MLWLVEVLLRNEDALAEEVLVDLLAVGLGDQPILGHVSALTATGRIGILHVGGICWL